MRRGAGARARRGHEDDGPVRVFIAGHAGLVGSAFVRRFAQRDDVELLAATRRQLDLTDGRAVERWLRRWRPEVVIIAAGKVGGIQANATSPAQFIYENLMIQANLIHAAWKTGAARLVNFGSSCMYPRECVQPMATELLLTGKLEQTSEPYALAKLAGSAMVAAYNRQYGTRFLSVVPCTLYGPNDNFDPVVGHVISALIRKFHQARQRGDESVTLWGTGQAKREFLYAEDLVEACEALMARYDGGEPVNVGSGASMTIRELAELVREITAFQGAIGWDTSRPDGSPEKQLDSSLIRRLGWSPSTELREGLARTYRWYLEQEAGKVREYPVK